MNYRRLGSSNLEVSTLCLGTMSFGERTDEVEAARIVAAARESGVNFIDTADVYNKGEAERMLGRCLAGDRGRWLLATKVGRAMSELPNHGGYSRAWLVKALEGSLARLATDWIDIYYLHRDFEATNLVETLQALGDLIRAGKIRYSGLSNFSGWRLAHIVGLCRELGVPQPVVCQPHYNLVNRVPEVEILPACAALGLGVVPYSPLARGVLTGKYLPGQPPLPGSRATRDARLIETEFREASLIVAQQLKLRADALGVPLGQYATAWLLRNQIVSAVVAGPRTLEQWQDYLAAAELVLSPEDDALVDSLVAPGHASTPGYSDPQYPVQGRRVPR